MEYLPNNYVKAMLILNKLNDNHVATRTQILEDLGFTQDDLNEIIGCLTVKGSEVDLNKANLFFDTKE